jgi:DNA replication protein DnaC
VNINWLHHGVGPRFKDADLSHIDPVYFEDVLEYANQYQIALQEGRGLLLSGSVGCGKTYSIVGLMKHIREQQDSRFDFYFITAPDLFEWMSEKNAIDKYRNKGWWHVFSTIPALVINDLGKEDRSREWLQEGVTAKLGRLLRKRHEAQLPIFITTNLPIVPVKHQASTTFQATYGEAIWSLIYDMTLFRTQVQAPDRRKGEHKLVTD